MNEDEDEDEPYWDWVELIGMVAVGALAFFIVYMWAK